MPYRQFAKADPRRYYTFATTKLGRRGTVLTLFGIVWIFQGLGFTIGSISEAGPAELFDVFRAVSWIASGLIALSFATTKKGSDIYGFLALYVMAAFRAAMHGIDFLLWIVPDGRTGDPLGIFGSFGWFCILILLVVVAGWDETESSEVTASEWR